jgi:hypothetical protein
MNLLMLRYLVSCRDLLAVYQLFVLLLAVESKYAMSVQVADSK